MAIERLTEMAGEEAAEAPPTETVEEVSETFQIPLSSLGGKSASPGDVVRLEIVTVDEEGGMLNVKYAKPKEQPKKLGLDSMAAQFD